MLSIPHMIVIFLVVLIVFGPQKLPELARGLGKLMAELRKASGDFRSAFEQEMRDIDRQAREAEWKKQQAGPAASTVPTAAETPGLPEPSANGATAAVTESVPRGTESEDATAGGLGSEDKTTGNTVPVSSEGGEPPHGII
jgi:TatA/E family protein of Tat protein translocase